MLLSQLAIGCFLVLLSLFVYLSMANLSNCDVLTKGWLRHAECKEICQNRTNERYGNDCGGTIGMATCAAPSGLYNGERCDSFVEPTFSCICKVGHVRLNYDGTGPCIPLTECPLKMVHTEKCAQKEENSGNGIVQNRKCADPNAKFEHLLDPRNCLPSCENHNTTQRQCSSWRDEKGCVCKEGYVSELPYGYGRCIKPEECPNKNDTSNNANGNVQPHQCADPNAEFHACASSFNTCLPSCDNPGAPPSNCTMSNFCQPRCLCKPGFVSEYSNGQGRCLKRKECLERKEEEKGDKNAISLLPQNKCADPNAEFHECASTLNTCLPSCHVKQPENCTMGNCCEPGCLCKLGYVSEYPNGQGRCMKEEECPPIIREWDKMKCADPNAELHTCLKASDHCFDSCEQPFVDSYLCGWDAECRYQCICKFGYVFEYPKAYGRCILETKCPPVKKRLEENNSSIPQCADPNAELHTCLVANDTCLPSCDRPFPSPQRCGWKDECRRQCVCKRGYVSEHPNGQGRCMREVDCPNRKELVGVPSKHHQPKHHPPKHHPKNHSQPENHLPFPRGNDSLNSSNDKCNPGEYLDQVCHDYSDSACANPNASLWENRQVCEPKKFDHRCICLKGYLRKNSDLCVPDWVKCAEEE